MWLLYNFVIVKNRISGEFIFSKKERIFQKSKNVIFEKKSTVTALQKSRHHRYEFPLLICGELTELQRNAGGGPLRFKESYPGDLGTDVDADDEQTIQTLYDNNQVIIVQQIEAVGSFLANHSIWIRTVWKA